MINKINLSKDPNDRSDEVEGGDFFYNTRLGRLFMVGITVKDNNKQVPRLFSMRDGMIYSSGGLFGMNNNKRNEFVRYNHSFEVNSHLDDV